MSKLSDRELMIKCARLVCDRVDQSKIAAELKISQSLVSKLLKKARDEEIIRTTLHLPQFTELEDKLCVAFGLRAASVIPYTEHSSPHSDYDLTNDLGEATARFFEKHAWDGCMVGLSGGFTMYEFVQAVSPLPLHLTVYPMLSWGDLTIKNIQASFLIAMWRCKHSDMDAYRLELPPLRGMPVQELTDNLKAQARHTNFIITGAGHVEAGSTFMRLITHAGCDPEEIRRSAVIGDLSGHPIITSKKKTLNLSSSIFCTHTLPDIARFAQDPNCFVIMAAGGEKKRAVITAVIHRRLCNTLITDEQTARALLPR